MNQNLIEKALCTIKKGGADFAEVFYENRKSSNLEMSMGKLEKVNSGTIQGVGLRGIIGKKAIYAYTNDLSEESVLNACKRVAQAINEKKDEDVSINLQREKTENISPILFFPDEISKTDKYHVMKLAHEGASNYSEQISEVKITFWDYRQNIVVANTEGLYKEDERVRSRVYISAVATKDGQKETGSVGPGAGMGFEFFNTIDVREAGAEAARIAVKMINAEFAPAGKMPVIISNKFGGVIFHEACGHALEATSVAKGASVFADKIGQKIAHECVSAVDDATIPNAWGSATIDDEGHPTQRNLLIENGVLKSYLIDKLGGIRMGMPSTGSGRRQNYTFAPTSRMSNTFILPGKYIPEEIIADTPKALFAKKMGGGSVNPSTGEFNFSVREGYMIENGRITKPVRGATLIGKGYEILQKIDMVANDLERDQGMCGSLSGSIPADVGQPTIRVSELIVGGRN
ncbi:MAG TPA: TldD/PmbA family protein [Thermotogota bacterium]|nr:TldD/PmbA family protein [Thermotogota bacterium]HPJ87995.1 TldD/PmbA family protein [Thermotogota bacterium]HPR95082.1 TldD/PmbA family protein [Thermotogota bacterium]